MMQSSNEKKHNTDTMQSILLWEMKYHNAYVKPIYKEGCCLAMKISSSLNEINHVSIYILFIFVT